MTFAHLKRTSYRSGSFRRAEKEKQRGCSLVPTSHVRSCGPAACPGAASLCRGAGGCSTLCSPCAHLHRSTLACSNLLCVILKYTVYRYGLCKSTFCKPLLKHRPFFLLHLPSNIYTMLFVREELKSVKERHSDWCFGSLYFRRRKGKGSSLKQEKEADHQSRRRPLCFFLREYHLDRGTVEPRLRTKVLLQLDLTGRCLQLCAPTHHHSPSNSWENQRLLTHHHSFI